ncbi:hypothetical protein QYE76_047266 [Lolium multiflorum]|uniref:GTD-binding domain-containing protein n=1 Tax=Lolium multiflorum TaxID=4521 RepID=A0AAD8X1T0_LOLMU|nr:hypothetical protein QYE76_047266 [Lolium multiflorum]
MSRRPSRNKSERIAVSQSASPLDLLLDKGLTEEESLTKSSVVSEAMAMMLHLQREKADVQMDLCQFCRLANEKIFIVVAKLEILEPAAASRTGIIMIFDAEEKGLRTPER